VVIVVNEVTPPVVRGGSNFIWMVTERQRRKIAKGQVCLHSAADEKAEHCPSPQIITGRRPGYSREEERELERERKQLKAQDDIEKALFDYGTPFTQSPSLFREDTTIKAALARDALLTNSGGNKEGSVGPQTVNRVITM
jgi:hypothetical protein